MCSLVISNRLAKPDGLLCVISLLQIAYSTVFFWEYFGPLVIYPLFFFFPQYLYPGQK